VRAILDALEDKETGKVLVPELHVQIPDYRVEEAKKCAEILGKHVVEEFPWVAGVKPMSSDVAEALLNRTWRPTLSVIGADGIPSVAVRKKEKKNLVSVSSLICC
jgi:hypothetical protein